MYALTKIACKYKIALSGFQLKFIQGVSFAWKSGKLVLYFYIKTQKEKSLKDKAESFHLDPWILVMTLVLPCSECSDQEVSPQRTLNLDSVNHWLTFCFSLFQKANVAFWKS